jgi:hypothetical protein
MRRTITTEAVDEQEALRNAAYRANKAFGGDTPYRLDVLQFEALDRDGNGEVTCWRYQIDATAL